LLIDQFLPRYDFAVVHAQVFGVPPEACLRAARNLDLFRHPAIRALLDLRALPGRAVSRLPCGYSTLTFASPARRARPEQAFGPPGSWSTQDRSAEDGCAAARGAWSPAGDGRRSLVFASMRPAA
jgi:hypothetical protein